MRIMSINELQCVKMIQKRPDPAECKKSGRGAITHQFFKWGALWNVFDLSLH